MYQRLNNSGSWTFYEKLVISTSVGGFVSNSMTIDLVGTTLVVSHIGSQSVRFYEFSAGSWSLSQTLTAPIAGDDFGQSIALDKTASRVVIGAHQDSNIITNNGAIYIYDKISGVWTFTTKLTTTNPQNGDRFGYTVAIGGANSDTVIASYQHKSGIHVFNLVASTWTEISGSPYPSPTAFSAQNRIAINDEGTIFALGNSQISIYEITFHVPLVYINTITSQIVTSTGSDDYKLDLAIRGNDVILSNRTEFDNDVSFIPVDYYNYDKVNNSFDYASSITTSLGNDNDDFGVAVDISADWAVIGASKHSALGTGAGAAYVFHYTGTRWAKTKKLLASDGAAGDQFGRSVAIDGNRVVVGAYLDDYIYNGSFSVSDAGSVYVFEYDGSDWLQTTKLVSGKGALANGASDDYFGFSVDVKADRILVGAHKDETNGADAGAAYIFDYDSGTSSWSRKRVQSADGSANAFGYNVSLDTNRILIGAYLDDDLGTNTGAAYVFDFDGTSWMQQNKIHPDSAISIYNNSHFGTAVSLQGDFAAIGASFDKNSAGTVTHGRVHIFKKHSTTGQWNRINTLIADNAASGDRFGYSLDFIENRIIVGAWRQGADYGTSYLYTRANITSPFLQTEEIKPLAILTSADSFFGVDVALNNDPANASEDWLLVGAHHQDLQSVEMDESGAVFVYDLSPTFTVGGSVAGLAAGNTLTLLNNGTDDLMVNSNGSFAFSTTYNDGSTYNVTVGLHPDNPIQLCSATNNTSGIISGQNINDMTFNCIHTDLIFSNGFESPTSLKLIEYLKTQQQFSNAFYDFATDTLNYKGHKLKLNDDYSSSKTQSVISWMHLIDKTPERQNNK